MPIRYFKKIKIKSVIKRVTMHSTDIKKVKVFLCVPASGKSYLAENNKQFIDIDREEEIYKYNLAKQISNLELAKGQGMHGDIVNKDCQIVMQKRALDCISQGKIILCSLRDYWIDFFVANKIDYAIVQYPPMLKDEFAQRMRMRGNTEIFINKIIKICTDMYEIRENDKNAYIKIDLKSGEHLSDIVYRYF